MLQHIAVIPSEQIAITVVSAEEMLRGRLAQVSRAKTAVQRVSAYYWFQETLSFLSEFPLLPYDTVSDAIFMDLRGQKLRTGTQDLRIAAIVLRQNAVLVTRNTQDFAPIPKLQVIDWSTK
ncbi:MAG TPA: type II toxin-antitoxin system VapC family toxin [Chloroflexota bacterium]|nr:type II toxin-antitoxin system VapC family toxin [Chloroflexota bacterium]